MIPEEERHKRLPEVGAPCAENNYLPSGMHRLHQLEWGMQPITHGALRVRESFPRKNNPITHAKESREGARLKQNLQCGTDEYIHWRSSVDCNKASRNALWSQDAPHGLQLSISWKPCQGCCQLTLPTPLDSSGTKAAIPVRTPQAPCRELQDKSLVINTYCNIGFSQVLRWLLYNVRNAFAVWM